MDYSVLVVQAEAKPKWVSIRGTRPVRPSLGQYGSVSERWREYVSQYDIVVVYKRTSGVADGGLYAIQSTMTTSESPADRL